MKGYEHYNKLKHLSPSSLACFSRCPRKYFYEKGCRLSTPVESIAMKFGEAMHFALPHAYSGDLESALKAFDSIWEGRVGDDVRNRGKAINLISNFINSHAEGKCIYIPQAPPKSRVKTKDCRSGYELAFGLDVGIDVPLVGRIDCVGKHRDTGKIVGVEYKTASRMGITYFEAFQRSPQIIAYSLALETLSGERVDTFFLEVIPTQKSNESSTLVPINFMHHCYEDFLKWVRYVYALIELCEKSEDFPQDFNGCNSYSSYGSAGYNCPYADLCSMSDWTEGLNFYTKDDYQPFIIEQEG